MSFAALLLLFHQVLALVGPLGELWLTLPFAAVLVAWCLLSGQYNGAVAVAGAVLGTVASIVVIKLVATLVGQPWRPHWEYISNLFPSGHAAMGTIVYGSLVICIRRAVPSLGIPCAVIVVALMALLSVQRVVSGNHPPLDVVGGLALGLSALFVLRRLWPSGSLRPIGLPLATVAAVLILQNFYGREVDSVHILLRATAQVHAMVATFRGLLALN